MIAKTLRELKAECLPPEMKPNDTGVIYVPVNESYHEWYWSQPENSEKEDE